MGLRLYLSKDSPIPAAFQDLTKGGRGTATFAGKSPAEKKATQATVDLGKQQRESGTAPAGTPGSSPAVGMASKRKDYGQPVDHFGKDRYPERPSNAIDETPSSWVVPKGQTPQYAQKQKMSYAAAENKRKADNLISQGKHEEAKPFLDAHQAEMSKVSTPSAKKKPSEQGVKAPAPQVATGAGLLSKPAEKAPPTVEQRADPAEHEALSQVAEKMGDKEIAQAHKQAAEAAKQKAKPEPKLVLDESKTKAKPAKKEPKSDEDKARESRARRDENAAQREAAKRVVESKRKSSRPETAQDQAVHSIHVKEAKDFHERAKKLRETADTPEKKEVLRVLMDAFEADSKQTWTPNSGERNRLSVLGAQIEGMEKEIAKDQKTKETAAKKAEADKAKAEKEAAKKAEKDQKLAEEVEASKPKVPVSDSDKARHLEHTSSAQALSNQLHTIEATSQDPTAKQLVQHYRKILQQHANSQHVPTKEQTAELKEIAKKIKAMTPEATTQPGAPKETQVEAYNTSRQSGSSNSNGMSAYQSGAQFGNQAAGAAAEGSGGQLGSTAVGYAGQGVVSAGHHLLAGDKKEPTNTQYREKTKKPDQQVQQSSLTKAFLSDPVEQDAFSILKSVSNTAHSLIRKSPIAEINKAYAVEEQYETPLHIKANQLSKLNTWTCDRLRKSISSLSNPDEQ